MQFNLLDILDAPVDYSDKRVMIPLSAGINSAAVLCVLGENHPETLKPKELHLYYDHFKEHSPGSFKFVADQIRYARRRFSIVKARINRRSVLKFFEREKMIPHPTVSPCSIQLKIKPRLAYQAEHSIDVVMVGFVRHELDRLRAQEGHGDERATYPISRMTDEDCFSIVKRVIGWYPPIYDIKERQGGKLKRVFSHNNCIPCKNWHTYQIERARKYFPEFIGKADDTAEKIGAYWGRHDDVPEVMACEACTLFN